MPKQPPRAARVALAAAVAAAVTLGTSACSFATLDPNSPGAGANASDNGTYVLNVVLVGNGPTSRVVASVQAPVDDTLVSIGGTPETVDGGAGTAYNTVKTQLPLKAGQLVNLDPKNYTMTSASQVVGLLANVTFTFEKGGAITLVAPITSTANPDYPSPSASPQT